MISLNTKSIEGGDKEDERRDGDAKDAAVTRITNGNTSVDTHIPIH